MFEGIAKFFKKFKKAEEQEMSSKDAAKERLHLVLMQDRANVSADFLELMKQEIIEVIKKYIDVDENAIDVRLTNKTKEDGTNGAPALYANIPIISIKNDKKAEIKGNKVESEDKKETVENKEEERKETKNDSEEDETKETPKEGNEKVNNKEENNKSQEEIDNNKEKEEPKEQKEKKEETVNSES